MCDKAMLVLGEAPESDDEDVQQQNSNNNFTDLKSGVAKNDQTESDSSCYNAQNSKGKKNQTVKGSCVGRAENYKMSEDTLLHRKLKEKNVQFYSNLTAFNKQMYVNAMNQMNETNQQLVKAQVLLQDTVTNWKYIEQNLSHIKRMMTDILSEEYIPKIKI